MNVSLRTVLRPTRYRVPIGLRRNQRGDHKTEVWSESLPASSRRLNVGQDAAFFPLPGLTGAGISITYCTSSMPYLTNLAEELDISNTAALEAISHLEMFRLVKILF